MPGRRPELTRADLPADLRPDTIRELPLGTLRRLSRPGNGVLTAEEQTAFDAALHEVMSDTARRLSGQLSRDDWANVARQAKRSRGRAGDSRSDEQLARLARRIGQQVDLAEGLAPGVDWSFAQHRPASAEPGADEASEKGDSTDTVSDLEDDLTDQVELVQVMTEIAEVSKRTYALEKQRDLQETRTVFFGFVVSVAVIIAGWAPLVAADDWSERLWVLGLTIGTCAAAGLVYFLVRRWQNQHPPDGEEPTQDAS